MKLRIKIIYFLPMVLWLFCFSTVSANASAISQGYQSSSTIVEGSLVSHKPNSTLIQNATEPTRSDLVGVATAGSNSSLAISTSSDNTQVTTAGITNAFVSTINGAISVGNPITISPISGVGMKATSYGTIVGFAEASTKPGAGTTVNVRTADGSSVQTTVQVIAVNVNVENYSPTPQGSPQALHLFANSVAGKPVSIDRLVVSTLVLVFAAIAVCVVLYAGIRQSFTAIGRNPLAQHSINRSLLKTIIGTVLMVAAALTFAYLILVA